MIRNPKVGQVFYTIYDSSISTYIVDEHIISEFDQEGGIRSTSNQYFFKDEVFSTKAGARKNALKVYADNRKGMKQ